MSVQYLKKTKMFHLLENIIKPEYMPKLSESEYRFYRGSEWIKFYIGYDIVCELYHHGCGISLDIDFLNDFDVLVSQDRLNFAYLDGELILNYWRNGSNQYIKNCISKTA